MEKVTTPTVLDVALQYAEMGFKVFPTRGKRPITPNGFKDASLVKSVIKEWYKSPEEDHGVAIVIPDWCVVVDIDGDEGIRVLNEHGYMLPTTSRVNTGKGWHFWYRRPEEVSLVRKIRVLPSVDLLMNGYVVAPPSRHPSGKTYAWDIPLSLDKIADAPSWVLTMASHDNAMKQKVNVEEFFDGIAEGERQTALFRYACYLRSRPKMTLIEAKVLVRELAKRSEGQGYRKYPDTDGLVDRVWKTYDAARDPDEEPEEHKIWTLADLDAARLPKRRHLVKDMLPSSGYTLITSPPKKGKSLIADYVAACVATGTAAWSLHKTNQAGVLVLDLEQDEVDALERWRCIFKDIGIKGWPANLHTAFTWPSMDAGGLDRLTEFLAEHPHISLVVIDTLADLWPEDEGKASSAYHREQRIMRKFVKISKEYGVAFLVVHHDRKGDGEFIQKASGTYAITGKAAAVWSFQREGTSHSAKLELSGKNIPDGLIFLKFDKPNLVWRLDTHAEDEN